MNGFLVLLSCTMDDFPILFTANEKTAIRKAKKVKKVPKRVQDIFGIGCL